MSFVSSPTLIPLSEQGVIVATGDDRISYLQSQLTCDLPKISADEWSWGGHCDPKGKLIAPFRLCIQEQRVLMLMPKALIAKDLPALNKYAVFNNITIADDSDQFELYALIGADAVNLLEGSGKVRTWDGGIALIDGPSAIILLEKGTELPTALINLPREEELLWNATEIRSCHPWITAEQSEEFVPQMVNLDAVGGIHYGKGCYIGQETIARMHFRGGNKRALFVLTGSNVDTTNNFEMQVGENWRRAGTIVATTTVGDETWLTAILNKDIEPDTAFRIGDKPLNIAPRPYTLFKEGVEN